MFLFQGGNYVLTLMDVYGGGIAILFIAISECIALIWLYGKLQKGFTPFSSLLI